LPEEVTEKIIDLIGKTLKFRCPRGGNIWHVGLIFEVRIFDSSGWEIGSNVEKETDEDEIEETMPHYSSRKRSWSQDYNSLPESKRVKISDCCTLCQEEEKAAYKAVHRVLSQKIEEFLESDSRNDVSLVKQINRQDEEQLKEARNNQLLVPSTKLSLEENQDSWKMDRMIPGKDQ
jgi:hypothetical protein